MILSIITFKIMVLFVTLCKKYSQNNNTRHKHKLSLCWVSLCWMLYFLIVMLNVALLSVTMLNVVFSYWYAECRYAECQYAEWHYAECHYAKCCGASIKPFILCTNILHFDLINQYWTGLNRVRFIYVNFYENTILKYFSKKIYGICSGVRR